MHYHIVGIAGAGMSAIAHVLLDQGATVSGSDLTANRLTATLAARGATIFAGHDPAYLVGADMVVATSAVPADHPELAAARAQGIPMVKRADLWRTWSQQRAVIAVAGTHGKTTTTAMIAFILTQAGLSPGFLVGGEAPDLGGNARWGDPHAPLVIEADEYDFTFLALTPQIAVVTNVEWDHPDIYTSEEHYRAAFSQFTSQTRECLVVSEEVDRAVVRCGAATRWLVYGFGAACDWRGVGYTGALQLTNGLPLVLGVPGSHNERNALAALAVADRLNIPIAQALATLAQFRGTARRFELKGEANGVLVVDDYAHHPTEVRATLAAARARYPERRIVAFFQPHTFSRTATLLAAWSTAFADANLVLVGNIYAAREQGDPVAMAHILCSRIGTNHPATMYVGAHAQAVATALAQLAPGDLFITLGAGDGDQVGIRVLDAYKR